MYLSWWCRPSLDSPDFRTWTQLLLEPMDLHIDLDIDLTWLGWPKFHRPWTKHVIALRALHRLVAAAAALLFLLLLLFLGVLDLCSYRAKFAAQLPCFLDNCTAAVLFVLRTIMLCACF